MHTGTLRNVWYVGALTSQVPVSGLKSVLILNEPVLLFRDSHGKTSALRDICPHRGIPFSYGRVVKDQVECPYHGWKFDGGGVCREIPSLCSGQDLDCTKIKVKTYPVIERQGLIWVFMGEKGFDPARIPEPPLMNSLPLDVKPRLHEIATFECHVDHAVIGLMDPAHGPYIHKSWLWRSEKSMIEKTKRFGPVDHGFRMLQHKPSANSKAYKILGGEITTEITFRLPGVRIEHIRVGKRNFYSFTGLTPVNDKQTVIHQVMYWDIPWLGVIKPFLKWFMHYFLYQDIDAVNKQQEGLKFDPSLMLIRDADTQAKWYYALKDEWENHLKENREFRNPVKETELRWRS
ncbi:MAG: aromatic ring-hydroxylating dioxygenase subunit alpha [Bdellovibrionaceae bacterium]|nr:aromatic ring-hydroxylating dioxygenase subunit alpha [Pseudobdellovibrionaceae bacterium]